MKKISLTDNSGHWFDMDSAKQWPEAIIFADDGTPVSRATGNSWEHEELFLTSHGSFVMHFSNDHNSSLHSFVKCEIKDAVKWLLNNFHNDDLLKLEMGGEENLYEI